MRDAYGNGSGYRKRGKRGHYRDRQGVVHRCRSAMERHRLLVLDLAGLRFKVEGVRIPYVYLGRPRTYITDILVFNRYGLPLRIEEIKPGELQGHPQNVAKWAAARTFCQSRYNPPVEFRVITEANIDRP